MVSYASIETYSFTYRGSDPPTPPQKKKKEHYIYAGEWINWAFVNWELGL